MPTCNFINQVTLNHFSPCTHPTHGQPTTCSAFTSFVLALKFNILNLQEAAIHSFASLPLCNINHVLHNSFTCAFQQTKTLVQVQVFVVSPQVIKFKLYWLSAHRGYQGHKRSQYSRIHKLIIDTTSHYMEKIIQISHILSAGRQMATCGIWLYVVQQTHQEPYVVSVTVMPHQDQRLYAAPPDVDEMWVSSVFHIGLIKT